MRFQYCIIPFTVKRMEKQSFFNRKCSFSISIDKYIVMDKQSRRQIYTEVPTRRDATKQISQYWNIWTVWNGASLEATMASPSLVNTASCRKIDKLKQDLRRLTFIALVIWNVPRECCWQTLTNAPEHSILMTRKITLMYFQLKLMI